MRNAKEKTVKKSISEENSELMQELEKIQQNIEKQENSCAALEKENQKLKMLQNFSSVFNKTQSSKDSLFITSVVKELNNLKSYLEEEAKEIGKLRREKKELTGKLALIEQEFCLIRPSTTTEASRKLARERSYNDIAFKFP